MQARVVVRSSFLMVLQRLEIWERRFADRAAVVLLRSLLFLDGVNVLMATEIRESTEHFAAYVTSVLRAFVTTCMLQKLLQLRKHHAAAALHTFVHF